MQVVQVVLVFLIFVDGTIANCIVGLLHDNDDSIKKLAFLSETEEHFLDPLIETISNGRYYNTLQTTCKMIQLGAIALFGPQIEENFQIVQSVCNSKDIPHIETRWDGKLEKSSSTVNLYPYAEHLGKALGDLVKSRKWETFTVFYEDQESLARITGILKVQWEYAISVKQLGYTKNYRPILKEAWRAGHTHFIVDCHISHLSEILKQAQQVGLMTSEHSYIITNLDLQTIDLEPYKYSDTNITGVRMVDPYAEATIRLAENINAKRRTMEIFQEFDDDDGFPDDNILPNEIRLDTALLADGIHLLYLALEELPMRNRCSSKALCDNNLSWQHGSSVVNYLTVQNSFQGVTGLVKLDSKGYRQEFKLDIIELRETGLTKIGFWNTTDGVTLLNQDDDQGSLEHSHFTVITTLTEPYGMLKRSSETLTGNDRYEGFAIDLIHELSLIEKFNYTFIIRHDKSNGNKDNVTGEWSGMIGDIIRKKADLAITDLTITSQRKSDVDFTTPFMSLGISILYRKPTKAQPEFFSFAAPFAINVWIWIGGAYFISSISLFIMGRLSPSEWNNPNPCVENPEYLINQFSLRNSFWFMLGSVLQQGSEIAPIGYATRMTAGAWWFFTLIMVSTYTANLAAFLTTETPDVVFSDVYRLLEVAPTLGIQYGAKRDGATLAFFKESKNNDFNQIYNNMISFGKEVLVSENEEGVKKAVKDKYAFFMESVSIEYATQRYCNLTQIGGMLDEKGYGIAMRKNSSYRHKLNTALLKLQENGKILDLKRKWWEEKKGGGQCRVQTKTDDAPALTLKNVEGVFWVTIGGTLIAVVLVFVEMVLHILKKSIKHKKPFCIELKEELKLYLKFRGLVKPARTKHSGSKSPVRSQHFREQEDVATYEFIPHITKPNTTDF